MKYGHYMDVSRPKSLAAVFPFSFHICFFFFHRRELSKEIRVDPRGKTVQSLGAPNRKQAFHSNEIYVRGSGNGKEKIVPKFVLNFKRSIRSSSDNIR